MMLTASRTDSIAHFEKEYLSRLVSRSGGNMSNAPVCEH